MKQATNSKEKKRESEEKIPPEEKMMPEKESSPEMSTENLEKDPVAEMKELLQRTQANFENYRKQNEKRMVELEKFAARRIILDILPIMDNLQLALRNAPQNEEFVKGVELIYQQLLALLDKYEIKIMETVGKKYDPYYHEALLKIPSEESEGIIIEEFQKGYILHGSVLRHARVKISAGKKERQNNIDEKNETKTI